MPMSTSQAFRTISRLKKYEEFGDELSPASKQLLEEAIDKVQHMFKAAPPFRFQTEREVFASFGITEADVEPTLKELGFR